MSSSESGKGSKPGKIEMPEGPGIAAYHAEHPDNWWGEKNRMRTDRQSILQYEQQIIRRRRAKHKNGSSSAAPAEGSQPKPVVQSPVGGKPAEDQPGDERKLLDDLTGLALSGGGIRAATFSLGVLQALDRYGIINRLDYLSTVSGGGYIGSSLSATLVKGNGEFAFGSSPQGTSLGAKPSKMLSASELADSDAVGHLRNYSNFLIPKGLGDVLTAAAVVVRGLTANAALILWIPLLLAALTVFSNPTRADLVKSDLFGFTLYWPPVQHFAVTLVFLASAFIYFFVWALLRSAVRAQMLADAVGRAPFYGALVLIAVALVAFIEFQPLAVNVLFDAMAPPKPMPGAPVAEGGRSFLTWLGLMLAPITAVITFFRQTLKSYLADTYYSKTYAALLARGTATLILWIGALALPLLIWIFYLHLSYWAIADGDDPATRFAHSPNWFLWLKEYLGGIAWVPYLVLGLLLFFFSFWLKSNANSLHHLYRDRLSRAFHFDPQSFRPGKPDPDGYIPQLTELASEDTPYHLINTAINVQSSAEANRRGRNADFFLFSPLFVGSRVTGYIPTRAYAHKKIDNPLDVATAVAISGASASSNMGSQTIRALSPTLAMLNVRLGYWLRNPSSVLKLIGGEPLEETVPMSDMARKSRSFLRKLKEILGTNGHFFLFFEMFGFLDEESSYVYLTDGGHIENLGIYELLRRRCKVIVVVDAETDPQMRFGSFIALQIHSRIDLGVRIDLPMEAIRKATLDTQKTISADAAGTAPAPLTPEKAAENGHAKPLMPHIAIGQIHYGKNQSGTLVYIKASLTGDENDYLLDYARRNPTFPHESTGDQFFTEEQFEVYRALGFHITDRFFGAKDDAIAMTADKCAARKVKDTMDPRIADIHNCLLP
ncbi:patatin-like phospholipase family protein [Mesorhizobium sp. YR577]|uniref:patatin-like phospholipase family protein n=1 Tax=Mesorhizobium sp. YR577 TaxID=1884373 RepID=UPI0008EDAFEC|nr:patatin-like phospholipase family protein [Mesorhizobium sp. YR577]SFU18277.1 Patatin-like phospholipase [Mesorhizobium sp. YR577]